MASPGLPTNLDTLYPDDPSDPSRKLHQQLHDTTDTYINKLDTTFLTASDNQVLTFDAATGTYKPETPSVVINVADYATPQAALDAAPAGARVFFPPTMATVAVPSGGLVLKSHYLTIDAMFTNFQVANWGTPAFLGLLSNGGGNNTTYRIGKVTYTGSRGTHTGTAVRGSAPYCSGCGVWTNGDRNFIEYLRTDGMPTPIFYSSWNGTSATDRMGVGNRIGYLEASGYDFALLYVRQEGFDWGDAYCSDDIDDSSAANPTHAIYCSASNGARAGTGTVGRWVTENHLFGHAYIFKYQDRLTFGSLVGYSTKGVVSFLDCADIDGESVIGTDQRSTGGEGAFASGFTTAINQRISINKVRIVTASGVNERAVSLYGNDCELELVSITSNRSSANVNDGELIIRGSRNHVGRLRTRAVGQTALAALLGTSTTDGAPDSVISEVAAVGSANDTQPVATFGSSGSARWVRRSTAMVAASPTTGVWVRGDEALNYAPTVGSPKSWLCTVTGGASSATWAATTAYTLNAWVKTSGGKVLQCMTAGTSSSSEPNPAAVGDVVADGTVSWTCRALTAATFVSTGNL